MKFLLRLTCLLVLGLPVAQFASAEIFRCIDKDGTTLYGDSPCPSGSVAAKTITQQIGECTTPDCLAARKQREQEAWQRLQADKEESARYRELRLRDEEQQLRAAAESARLAALEAQMQDRPGYQEPAYPWIFYPSPAFCHRHHFHSACRGVFPTRFLPRNPSHRTNKPAREPARSVLMK